MRARLAICCFILMLGAHVSWAVLDGDDAFPSYTVTVVNDIPDAQYPGAVDINNTSDILIWTTFKTVKQTRSYVWSQGVLTDIGSLSDSDSGSTFTFAHAINDKRQVVGVSTTRDGYRHAFLWQNGKMTDLGTLGGKVSEAWDINNSGQVVGEAEDAKGERHAFIWDAQNGMRSLGIPGSHNSAYRINDRGQVLGLTDSNTATFLWQDRKHTIIAPTPPTGFHSFQGVNLNDKGDVIGSFNQGGPHGESRIGLTSGGKLVLVETPQPCRNSNAFGVTSARLVAGNAFDTPTGQHAFVWKNGKSKFLNDLLVPGTGWDIYFTVAVNDKGYIAASGSLEGKQRIVLLTPQ